MHAGDLVMAIMIMMRRRMIAVSPRFCLSLSLCHIYLWQVILGVWLFYAACYLVMQEFSTCSIGYYCFLIVIYVLLFCEIMWGLNYVMTEQKQDPDSIAEGNKNDRLIDP